MSTALDPDAWLAAGEWRVHDGHRQFLRDDGDGPALLVLHGFPTSSLDFAPLWPRLTARFRVLTVDHLGFGFSDKPPDRNYSMMDAADQACGLLKERGIAHAHVVAHDYGVSVAQELIARHHDRSLGWTLRSVLFLNGGLFPEQHRPRPIQKLLRTPLGPAIGRLMSYRTFSKRFAAVFGPRTQPSEAELRVFWSLVQRAHGNRVAHRLIRYIDERKLHRDRWVSAVLDASVPTRLVNGTADPVSGGHVVDYWRGRRPDADLVRLEDIGHYPQVEAPDAVWDAAVEFWDRMGT